MKRIKQSFSSGTKYIRLTNSVPFMEEEEEEATKVQVKMLTIYPLNALYLRHIKSAHRVHYYNGTYFVFNREPYRKMPNMFVSPTKLAQLTNDDETDVSSVDFKNVSL